MAVDLTWELGGKRPQFLSLKRVLSIVFHKSHSSELVVVTSYEQNIRKLQCVSQWINLGFRLVRRGRVAKLEADLPDTCTSVYLDEMR